jgi:hypothetical protein
MQTNGAQMVCRFGLLERNVGPVRRYQYGMGYPSCQVDSRMRKYRKPLE